MRLIASNFEKQAAANILFVCVGQPNVMAKVVILLESDDSSWISSERISVSGGFK